MQTFIDKTAEYLLSRFPRGLENVCVVFPNRRAGLFLKESLSSRIDKPIWVPAVFAIEDFVFRVSGYKPVDSFRLRFYLYQVYLDLESGAPQPFYEFLNWADVLLKDFNDADMALADIDSLFGYLSESKALSLWNPEGTPLTDFQLRYLRFYASLSSYYKRLKDQLISKGQLYQGLAYRTLAEKLMNERVELPWNFIVFAGFNAMSNAEDQIVKSFIGRGSADILWDADCYYFDDINQEAGHYLRKHFKSFNKAEFKWKGNYFQDISKSIEMIGIPQNVAQVKYCGMLLSDLMKEGNDPRKTAVILNDETLLIPLLNSLPPEINDLNVTMGLPLQNTPLFRLIHCLITLNENALNFTGGINNEIRFFHADLVSFVEHHYFNHLLEFRTGLGSRRIFSDWIIQKNKTFISYNEIPDIFSSAGIAIDVADLTGVFRPWGNNVYQAIDAILSLLKMLRHLFFDEAERLQKFQRNLDIEYIFHFTSVFRNLDEMVRSFDYIQDLRSFRMVFYQMIQSIRLPFYGEPLKGSQIMGMLESRSLDFENLIMLSVNDDYIPAGKSSNSFIPLEIKHLYQISSFKDRDSIFAYHFYRLLQRAKRIYLLYNTEPGKLSGGDKSRFLFQIQHELKVKIPQIQLKERLVELPVADHVDNSKSISKDKFVMERLHLLAEKGFSASSLNTYRRCSLQFFYRYIAGIDENREIEETIEESTLGSVVHEVLEILYHPTKGKILRSQHIKEMLLQADTALNTALSRHFAGGELKFGKNLLIVKVAQSFIINFLNKEIQWLKEIEESGSQLSVMDLEKKFTKSFELLKDPKVITIKLTGYFDRVDICDGKIRIIDYKTGKVDQKDLKFTNWDDLLQDTSLDKCFQLLFYHYLYSANFPDRHDKIEAMIVSLRNLKAGPLRLMTPENESSMMIMKKMESVLSLLFEELFDPHKDFTMTDKPEDCLYCSFKTICNR
jgi:ATP-dependent helicase/nuclease subunit B